MKLYYLSTTSFTCVDINVLHHLSTKYDITYGVIIPDKNANFSEEELTTYCSVNNIKEDFFRLKYRYRDPRTLLVYGAILWNIIRSKPDLIFVNNFDQLYFNLLLMLLSKRKTVIAMHDVVSHSGTSFAAFTAFSRTILLNKFTQFLTFSPSQAAILKKLRPNRTVHMIPLALEDFGTAIASPKKAGIIDLLFFGNIKPYKGLDILLKSINRLSQTHTSFKLTIAGRCANWEEVYEPLLEHEELVDKQIRFIANDEIPSFFANTDYLILPYKDATQSGPLMIAYNYNVPVIASNIAGFKEFIDDGKTGYLFDLNSDESIDNVLEQALLRGKSAYQTLRANVAAYKEQNLSIESTINAYDTLFNHVTESQKS